MWGLFPVVTIRLAGNQRRLQEVTSLVTSFAKCELSLEPLSELSVSKGHYRRVQANASGHNWIDLQPIRARQHVT